MIQGNITYNNHNSKITSIIMIIIIIIIIIIIKIPLNHQPTMINCLFRADVNILNCNAWYNMLCLHSIGCIVFRGQAGIRFIHRPQGLPGCILQGRPSPPARGRGKAYGLRWGTSVSDRQSRASCAEAEGWGDVQWPTLRGDGTGRACHRSGSHAAREAPTLATVFH